MNYILTSSFAEDSLNSNRATEKEGGLWKKGTLRERDLRDSEELTGGAGGKDKQ